MVDAPTLLPEGRPDDRTRLGYAMVATAATLFAVNGSVSKVVLDSGLSSLELAQIRATCAALGLLGFLSHSRDPRSASAAASSCFSSPSGSSASHSCSGSTSSRSTTCRSEWRC